MSIRVKCSCGKTLTAPDSSGGKKGRCPSCGAQFIIPMPSQEAAQAAPPPQSGTAPQAVPPPMQPPPQSAPPQAAAAPPPGPMPQPAAAPAPPPPQPGPLTWTQTPTAPAGPAQGPAQASPRADIGPSASHRLITSLVVVFGVLAVTAVSFVVIITLRPGGTGAWGGLPDFRRRIPAPEPSSGFPTRSPFQPPAREFPAPVDTASPLSGGALVGKWQQADGGDIVEFLADGTVTSTSGETTRTGTYKILQGSRVRLEWQATADAMLPVDVDITVSGDTLTLTQMGASTTYKRVRTP